jgi:hypothetical protein
LGCGPSEPDWKYTLQARLVSSVTVDADQAKPEFPSSSGGQNAPSIPGPVPLLQKQPSLQELDKQLSVSGQGPPVCVLGQPRIIDRNSEIVGKRQSLCPQNVSAAHRSTAGCQSNMPTPWATSQVKLLVTSYQVLSVA